MHHPPGATLYVIFHSDFFKKRFLTCPKNAEELWEPQKARKLGSKKENTNSLFSVSHDLKLLRVVSGASGQGQSHAGQPLAPLFSHPLDQERQHFSSPPYDPFCDTVF